MNVLRHDCVNDLGEAVALPHLAKKMDENISGANRTQKGQAPVTSEGYEMQVAASIPANEFTGHGTKEKSNSRPFKTERVSHPEKLNYFLCGDVLK